MRTARFSLLALALLAAPVLSACGGGSDVDGSGGGAADLGATGASGANDANPASAHKTLAHKYGVCSDGEILEIERASDEGEVTLAKFVLKKTQDPTVRAFAERMIKDHGDALKSLMALRDKLNVPFQSNGIADELTESTQLEMQALGQKSGKEFDQGYIDHEVVDHIGDLGNIDRLLLPSVNHAKIRSDLFESRATVAKHLDLAVAAQSKLEGKCGGGPTSSSAGSAQGGSNGISAGPQQAGGQSH
ncbi:MAG TPA: DUF4142 domain-containing protein [Minicystis sp.]|nr:DUF4142 domain-containing protein [Minicystis sp.]